MTEGTGFGLEPASASAAVETPAAVSVAPAPASAEASADRPLAAAAVRYAGFWRRALGFLLDGILTTAIGFADNSLMRLSAGLPVSALWGEYPPGASSLYKALEFSMGIVIGWIYFAAFESSARQATPGKMAIGIRVTDLSGRRIGFARATGRHFGKIISALLLLVGFLMAAFTPRKQALHDIMAGTLVVKG